MNKYIIQKYINKLTKQDIINYSSNEKISLSQKEIDIIYEYIKTRYLDFLSGNQDIILKELKSKLNSKTYQKIEELYQQYKNKI